MAATSSSHSSNYAYDVFLSFRGEDTRYNFISHLYEALKTKRIHTFKDDKELKRGKFITPSLIEAIENSRIAVVVFSENYASSPWCLDELNEIVRCREIQEQIILPIFFKVDPSDIEMQTGILTKAFEEHELNFENDKVQSWRNALSTVATISGWDSTKCFDGNEAILIKCIVRDILDRLICDGSCFKDDLVGIDSHMMEINKLLNLDCNDVRMVGIWGPGGIGKTTIADFIYHKNFSKFKACYRIKNIKDKHKKDGLIVLQKELISQMLLENYTNIWDVDSGCCVIRKRLQGKKVLIVLDDVDELEQLKSLANHTGWFVSGSRIIITTRDKRLLILHGVKHIYEVQALKEDQDLQLFSLHAFRKKQPFDDFLELSKKFLLYARGLPLALKVLGTSLFDRKIGFWHSEFEKLKRIPDANIYQVLKVSFDGLDYYVKAVFLDVVFFFNGENKSSVENILSRCGFYPERAFDILKEKALLTFEAGNLYMHELILGMGREIVREESEENLSQRSRLCDPKDVYSFLVDEEGSRRTQGISLDMSRISSIHLEPEIFKGMCRLRILKFYLPSNFYAQQPIHFVRDLDFLPNSLTYIRWDSFPLKSLPSTFSGRNLVELELPNSEVEHLWTGDIELVNLKKIVLAGSKCLKTLPDLSNAIKIEKIILFGCESLMGFSHDLQHLEKLHELILNGCKKFDKLPSKLPSNLKTLRLQGTAIKELPWEIQFLANLSVLSLDSCKKLSTLPVQIGALESLEVLNLRRSGIKELPQSIGKLKSLQSLDLENIVQLPQSIGGLKSLVCLELDGGSMLELPESVGDMHNLRYLRLFRCTELIRLPNSMHQLSSLVEIYLRDCKSLCSLPELPPSLKSLGVSSSSSLETLPNDGCWSYLPKLWDIGFIGCLKLDREACREILKHFKDKSSSSLRCIVPGNEIPEWCHFKSYESSSITIKLPPYSCELKWIVFSFVFGPENPQDAWSSDGWTWLTYTVYDNTDTPFFTSGFCEGFPQCGVDHVTLHCINIGLIEALKHHLSQNLGCDVWIEFMFKPSKGMVVKKCGAHLITNEGGIEGSSALHDQSSHGDKALLESGDDEQCSKRRKVTQAIQ